MYIEISPELLQEVEARMRKAPGRRTTSRACRLPTVQEIGQFVFFILFILIELINIINSFI